MLGRERLASFGKHSSETVAVPVIHEDLIRGLDGDKEFKNGSPNVPVVRWLTAPLDPSPGHLGVAVFRSSNRLSDGPASGMTRSMAWIVRKKPIWLPS